MDKFLININGEFFNESNARISVFDRGFLYGDSVYEATRTFKRVPFRLQNHLDRLFISAQKIEMIPTLSKDEILKRIKETIKASPHENISMRIILSRGTNSDLGLDPDLSGENNLVIITKAIEPNPAWWLTKGLSMIFFNRSSTQKGALSKSGNYQENILAFKFAQDQKADDAIMVNPEGHVTEGTTSNIWFIKDGTIHTPTLKDGLLEGLTRKTLLEMALRKNISLKEGSYTKDDFLSADECFISSTTRNLVPVTRIEGKKIGSGLPGKQTIELLEMYLEFVAEDI